MLLGMVDLGDVEQKLPTSDERRSILAKDPLASVYGFRVTCKLVMSMLFGAKACYKCPDCNQCDGGGCVDPFGSVSTIAGGIFGRPDAYYGSIENQKEDSQHLHMLLWLQNMYQHQTIDEIANAIRADNSLIQKTYEFVGHVCKEEYTNPDLFEQQREKLEEESPEHVDDNTLINKPKTDGAEDEFFQFVSDNWGDVTGCN